MQSIPACSVADVAAAARAHGMTLSTMVERTMQAAGRRSVRRLYVGSNFCSQYFLRQPDQVWREAFSLCRREGIPATLVVPVFSQKDLAEARRRIDELVGANRGVVDEITVNDVGMVAYCLDRYGLPLNAGRLFSRSRATRAMRSSSRSGMRWAFPRSSPSCSARASCRGWSSTPRMRRWTCRRTARLHAASSSVGVHMPYCYLSTGTRSASWPSIGRPVREKFRPNAAVRAGMRALRRSATGCRTARGC